MNVVIYQSSDGLVKMEAIVDASNETIWATQKAMAQLFGAEKDKSFHSSIGQIYQTWGWTGTLPRRPRKFVSSSPVRELWKLSLRH